MVDYQEGEKPINLSDSSDDGIDDEPIDDDMENDGGLNLGVALANNQFQSKNIFDGQKGAIKRSDEYQMQQQPK